MARVANYKTLEYHSWDAMRGRCLRQSNIGYAQYGGMGIKICDAWVNSFQTFLRDMGPRPSKAYSLDRYPDNAGNYEPGNCRWATRSEQNTNQKRRTQIFNRVDGKYMGVWPHRRKWQARFAAKHLGSFKTPEDAAIAYNFAVYDAYGDSAKFNLPKELQG